MSSKLNQISTVSELILVAVDRNAQVRDKYDTYKEITEHCGTQTNALLFTYGLCGFKDPPKTLGELGPVLWGVINSSDALLASEGGPDLDPAFKAAQMSLEKFTDAGVDEEGRGSHWQKRLVAGRGRSNVRGYSKDNWEHTRHD